MNRNKYNIKMHISNNEGVRTYHFWEDKIRKHTVDEILTGNLEGGLITRNSIFTYMGMEDRQKNIFKSGWKVHENLDALIGYLVHVFLPTVYFNWIDRVSDGFFIPIVPFLVVKKEVIKTLDDDDRETMDLKYGKAIEMLREKILNLYKLERAKALVILKDYFEEFNQLFGEQSSKQFFFRVFSDTLEIKDFILGDPEAHFEEVIEEEIGMTIVDLEDLCEKVYDESFINRTFLDRLNREISIWF